QLRLTGPGAGISSNLGQSLFTQIGLTSGCVNNVLLPTGDVVLQDSGSGYNFTSGVPNFKEFMYAATGLAGESQEFDGNGPFLRFFSAGGPTPPGGPVPNLRQAVPGGGPKQDALWGGSTTPPLGTRPPDTHPQLNTPAPCQNTPTPHLTGPAAAQGPTSPSAYP